jgi:tetratricopeptide (TPR) repeat protein
VQTADLSDEQQFPDFAALETWLETAGQGRAVIHLTNTSHWLQGPRVETLNLRRNALAEKLDATLLWWLPADTLARLARDAPDAWSWRGGVFDFIAERPDQAEPVPIRRETSDDINPLTLAQRSRRLAVLHQQLDGEGSTTIPDDFRLNLLLEQADLYKSLGQWDLANQKLRQEALPLAERLGDARGEALALGRIADILADRGELDEALRIRTQEDLPVYERLGDAREKAMTQSKIADILRHHGELDEALHVFQRDCQRTQARSP